MTKMTDVSRIADDANQGFETANIDSKFKVLFVYANSFMDTLLPVSIFSISGAFNELA